MQKVNYTADFKEEAILQIIDRCNSIIDVTKKLGIRNGLLYT